MHNPNNEIERKSITILKILYQAKEPVGARIISNKLKTFGMNMSERAVRYHLQFMDERGLTSQIGKNDGRILTQKGKSEIENARVHDKVGLSDIRIETLSYKTTFDLKNLTGLIPVNVSFFHKDKISAALTAMKTAFDAGLCVSQLVKTAGEGEAIGELSVPENHVGIATVCSLVINGVLLKSGIHMQPKFGGILEIVNSKPIRFTELIHYSGSSLDPSEAFIRAKMTSVNDVVKRSEGMILANYREVIGICRPIVEETVIALKKAGIKGVLSMGEISQPICQVNDDPSRFGMILIGGLNPVAAAQEKSIEAKNISMGALVEYGELQEFSKAFWAMKS